MNNIPLHQMATTSVAVAAKGQWTSGKHWSSATTIVIGSAAIAGICTRRCYTSNPEWWTPASMDMIQARNNAKTPRSAPTDAIARS